MTTTDAYVYAVHVDAMFVDTTYQRDPDADPNRVKKMAKEWDRRLAGIIEVSDRGEHVNPRYAIIDGGHRWAAARLLPDPPLLVANVHETLTVADEARLFDKLNRERKRTNVFDHYRARLASGDWTITQVNRILTKHSLKADPAPREGYVGCLGTLEKVAQIDDALLDEVLELIIGIWGRRRDAFDAPIIHGLALILNHLRDEIDLERLVDALLDVMPRHLSTQAVALRDLQSGTLPVLTAIVIIGMYNKKPGRKLDVTPKTFGGVGRGGNNQPRAAADVGVAS